MLLDEMESAARAAGRIILSRKELAVEAKEGHANFVTNIDKQVQRLLETRLSALLPGSRFIGEEKENGFLTDDPTWIVDPVDGTTNLIHDYRQSCISIALTENKHPVTALIYQPFTDEMFTAEAGKGARLNGKSIHVSSNPFESALVAFGTSPYHGELRQKSMLTALDFLALCADVRRSGSAAIDLVTVACGRADIFFEYSLKPWDVAAGALILTEAGGAFEMPLSTDGVSFAHDGAILAANGVCRDKAYGVFMARAKGL